MLKKKQKKTIRVHCDGFTMMEILIVIGILIVLGGIAFVGINPAEQLAKARNNQRNVHIEAIYGAIEHYAFQNSGALPGSGGNCFDGKIAEATFGAHECEAFLTPYFLNEIPVDPVQGAPGDSGYLIKKDNRGRVGVMAVYAEREEEISVGTW